jgi:predicted GNAT superfamily acetyltransferase
MVQDIRIYQLSKFEEFAEIVSLQKEIWGYDEIELLPQRFFIVANKIGGQVLGAFDGKKMVAFCICIPGCLARLPQYRGRPADEAEAAPVRFGRGCAAD